jgi:hypothetical protein
MAALCVRPRDIIFYERNIIGRLAKSWCGSFVFARRWHLRRSRFVAYAASKIVCGISRADLVELF